MCRFLQGPGPALASTRRISQRQNRNLGRNNKVGCRLLTGPSPHLRDPRNVMPATTPAGSVLALHPSVQLIYKQLAHSTNQANKMSGEYAFRKINIDALDEDVLLPSDLVDPDPRGPDGMLADAKRRSGDVRGLVSK